MKKKITNYLSTPVHLEKDHRKSAFWVWMLFIAIAIVYDFFAIRTKKRESLTRTFWRHTDHPIKGTFALGLWLSITAHLILEKPLRRRKSK